MAVPNLANAVRGWTQRRTIQIVSKPVVNHQVVETRSDVTLDINLQPMPAQEVVRRPEDQREWKWWNVIIRRGPLLNIDDVLIADGIDYRIVKVHNWSESGFQKYEAIEDYGT